MCWSETAVGYMWVLLGVGIVFVFGVARVVSMHAGAQEDVLGNKAPSFELESISGETVKMSDFKGKVVHVSEVPEPASWLNADVKEYAVLVSIDGSTDGLRVGLTALVELDAGPPR